MPRGIDAFEISQGKVIDYLLNIAHSQGGSKAKFFIGRGFRVEAPQELSDALAMQAMTNWPGSMLDGTHGVKHRIVAPLACPNGTTPIIVAVWMAERGGKSAWFVTAYPNR